MTAAPPPSPPSAADAWRLTPDEAEAIYRQRIVAKYLPRSQPQAAPLAIITGGQPGSGKSRLVDRAIEHIGRIGGGYVLGDADKLRPYHPHFRPLLATGDKMAADLTHRDCGAWAARLIRDGAAGRRHLVIDQTSRDPAALRRTATDLHALGYRVELHVMATPPLVSEQRIHARYEDQKAAKGTGRYSNKANHDAALGGILDTVQAAEAGRLVDRLCLYDKEARPIYDNRLISGNWTIQPPAAYATLEAARAQRLAPRDARALLVECQRLDGLVCSRNGTQAEIDAIRSLTHRAAAAFASARVKPRSRGR